ncbi:MAG: glycosyltransferase, partial [Candidatus Avelusimicrobium sp.]
MKPLRVLQIISNLEQGSGVAQVVLNWHRNIDTTKVQFDYLCFKTSDTYLENEIIQKGSNVYCIPYKGIAHSFSFIKQSIIFFKEHRYQILHSHITHLNLIFYPLAKIFGVKHIIQHAHLTTWSEKKANGTRNYLMLHTVWSLITHKLACSEKAGEAYYGKNYTVINNGIDVEKFSFNPNIRKEKRTKLGLENNFVVANIGRFNLQKNHKFLIEIFTILAKKEKTAKLVLVGSGPLEKDIKP